MGLSRCGFHNEESPDNAEPPHHLTGGSWLKNQEQKVSQKITASIRWGKGENVR
jgi:hypothetical protein